MAGIATPNMVGVGVAWAWFNIFSIFYKKITQSWQIFATVTGSLAAWSHSHRQFILDSHRL